MQHEVLGAVSVVVERFKIEVYYYSGTVRLTDQETTGIEKTVGYSQCPRGEGMPCSGVHTGSTGVTQRSQWGNRPEASLWEATGEAGRAGQGPGSLKPLSWLWG